MSSHPARPEELDLRVNDKYKLGRKVGSGSFGDIYEGTDINTNEQVAIKLEPHRSRHPQLLYEAKLYRILSGGKGIPNSHWYGVEGDYNVLVIDYLGSSLEDNFDFCARKFSLKTVLMLADQMLQRIEYMHSKKFLHRDIKPDNFLMGRGFSEFRKCEGFGTVTFEQYWAAVKAKRMSDSPDCEKLPKEQDEAQRVWQKSARVGMVYVIDFGLSKKYIDSRTQQHIPYKEGKNLTGTARYASVNTHLGIEQGRRDDLEALGYVFMYFLRGSLPWQGLKANTKKEKYERIMEKKISTELEELCKNFPSQFITYLEYTRKLKFEETPDYNYLRKLFHDLFKQKGYTWDYVYDWDLKRQKQDSKAVTSPTGAEAAQSPNPRVTDK